MSGTARPPPPQPVRSQDTAFFWEGLHGGQLLVQRCTRCGVLRHPPGPVCVQCHSLDWEAVPCSGQGRLFSFVVVHQPRHPAFDYPLPVGLVELDEGVRIVAPLRGIAPEALAAGLRLRAVIEPVPGEDRLPWFVPAAGEGAA